ncbi:MAG: Tad domain-containing protein [Chloroflexota bacterium]
MNKHPVSIRVRSSERGQAIILIVVAMVGILAITGLAVDGGRAYADRRQAQNAADSAVLAAALAKIRGDSASAVAYQTAAQNGYARDGERAEVEFHNPPTSGPYKGNAEYMQVIVTSHIPTTFGRVVTIERLTNTVEAVARVKPSQWGEIMYGYSVVSLAPNSDCLNNRAFWLHGEATLSIEGGGLFVNSNNRACAFTQRGNGSLLVMDSSPVNVVGGASIQKLELIKRLTYADFLNKRNTRDWDRGIPFLPSTGVSPLSYPPPFVLPKPVCNKPAEISRSGSSMSAGYWDEDFPPDGVTDLEEGVYCISGDLWINGSDTLRGDDVLLVVEKGRVHFDGNATIQLSAPSKGPFKGLLLYLPIENTNRVILNGNADSKITGTILAPGSFIRITGNDSTYGFHSQIIGYRIELDGNSVLIVKYINDQNYDAQIAPEIQLIQ